MKPSHRNWILSAVIVIGVLLVIIGWTVDYFSTGDPHFWDSFGFAVIASAVAAWLYRKWRLIPESAAENFASVHERG
ncbi:hypothetical protein [Candidatus Laterigemmans baculatus]|uniref:hypothetical protein n=1 Tax=Candidatus Laterigemmans baculatus TaxID=2770505 RepID=UPI0013DB8AF0|nr:hypothetical protein [Candidatus Laterigemmans baculatus]